MGKRSPIKSKAADNDDVEGHFDISSKKPKYEINDLLSKVQELIEDFNYELALKFSEKALLIEPENTDVLETIGNVSAELGDSESAKKYLLKSVNLKPNEGHVKYLYLGQLSEGTESVEYYKKAISMMTVLLDTEQENKISSRDISNVYCSLAELYMTDCCMEENAEQLCETSCKQALQLDEENPEAHIVMCNFLLTKGDVKSAQDIALKLYVVWDTLSKNDGDNIVELISYETRLTLIKILIEVEFYDKVSSIGIQLLEENEDDIRTWYYIGLSKSLLKEVDGHQYHLETALYLYEKNNLQDEDMLTHLQELLSNCPNEETTIENNGEQTVRENESINGMDLDG